MKPKLILCLALVLSGAWTAFSTSGADTNSLRVVVIPSKTEVHVKETFKVALRVENPTTTNQTVRVWSCSWDQEWKTSNTNISWIGWDCTRNGIKNVEILPGGAYTNELEMLIPEPISEGTLSFRMGFTPIDSKQTFLSDEVKLNVRHFGDAAPLRPLLSELHDKIPELSAQFPAGPSYGENSVTATFHQSSGRDLRIIAKAYDFAEAAKEGQKSDSQGISVNADRTEIIQGVEVHEYTRYGGIYFQVGVYTFRIESAEAMPFLLKVGSALIDEVKQTDSQTGSSL